MLLVRGVLVAPWEQSGRLKSIPYGPRSPVLDPGLHDRPPTSHPPSISWSPFLLAAVSRGLFCLDTKRLVLLPVVLLDCSHPKGSSYHFTQPVL